mgnify:CR=1 FL=1
MGLSLHKSLYGHKQAFRDWFSKLTHALKQYSFIQTQADTTPFTLKTNNSFLVVLVYVDDMVIAGNDSFQCQKFKQFLHGQVHLKDFVPLKFFLDIEVGRSPEGIFLSQRKYALDILTDTGLSGAKLVRFQCLHNIN